MNKQNNENDQNHCIDFETMYCKENDITFVMKRIYSNQGIVEDKNVERLEKVIGFYYGEPNIICTNSCITHDVLKQKGLVSEPIDNAL